MIQHFLFMLNQMFTFQSTQYGQSLSIHVYCLTEKRKSGGKEGPNIELELKHNSYSKVH